LREQDSTPQVLQNKLVDLGRPDLKEKLFVVTSGMQWLSRRRNEAFGKIRFNEQLAESAKHDDERKTYLARLPKWREEVAAVEEMIAQARAEEQELRAAIIAE
jgi:hypothetical protein